MRLTKLSLVRNTTYSSPKGTNPPLSGDRPRGNDMSDRFATSLEKSGTFIQHKISGRKGTITFHTFGGYKVNFTTDKITEFIPYSQIGEYVVIE